jgi:hypothetical protein
MIKYLLIGIILSIAYRFWNKTPKIDKTGQEPEEYADYEEID